MPQHITHFGALQYARAALRLVLVMILGGYAVLAGRLIVIGVQADGPGHTLAEAAPAAYAPPRADLIDRNGLLLATDLATWSVYANPRLLLDRRETAEKLASVFTDLDAKTLNQRLNTSRHFVWIKRHITPQQRYAVNRLGLPGIDFRSDWRRIYPNGTLAAHVLGYTDIDGRGISGIEKSLDGAIRRSRKPVPLSLDARLQLIVEEELTATVSQFQAKAAAAIVMDVHSFEILSMVSLPTFDPNTPGDYPPAAHFNRASLGVYEMGSTVKILNTAMALESGTATLSSSFDATSPIYEDRFRINDLYPKRRWLSVPEILMYSSNIGSAKMAMAMGREKQQAFLSRLRLDRMLPLEISEVGTPLLPKYWRDIHTMTVAYGHGFSISALHLASAVAATVNGGYIRTPTLLNTANARPGSKVFSDETVVAMRQLLRAVVLKGSGKRAEIPGYFIGGKTGTAEKTTKGGYNKSLSLSSFVGVFPIHQPRWLVFVMVDEPIGQEETHGFATGGLVATPAVGRIIARMGPLLGIAPVPADSQNYTMIETSLAIPEQTVNAYVTP